MILSMTQASFIYNLEDYEKIEYGDFLFKLPNKTIAIISQLQEQVGAPSYIKTPIFQKRDAKYGVKRRGQNNEDGNSNWDSIRNSITITKRIKREGIDETIDNLKSCLNKMTNKNYQKNYEKIKSIIDENALEYMIDMAHTIFEVMGNNKFYSEMYAELTSGLIDTFPQLKCELINFFDNYKSNLFGEIESIDSDKDYEKLCRVNSENDKRRSQSAFFGNLMLKEIISCKDIIDIIVELQKKIVISLETVLKQKYIEELVENISILSIYLCKSNTKDERWIDIKEHIACMSMMNINSKPGMSSKLKFKYMDMLDVIERE